jgi:hypothetical protein
MTLEMIANVETNHKTIAEKNHPISTAERRFPIHHSAGKTTPYPKQCILSQEFRSLHTEMMTYAWYLVGS